VRGWLVVKAKLVMATVCEPNLENR
jgi:hypothetical protein